MDEGASPFLGGIQRKKNIFQEAPPHAHVAEKLVGQSQVIVQRQEGDALQAHHDDLRGPEGVSAPRPPLGTPTPSVPSPGTGSPAPPAPSFRGISRRRLRRLRPAAAAPWSPRPPAHTPCGTAAGGPRGQPAVAVSLPGRRDAPLPGSGKGMEGQLAAMVGVVGLGDGHTWSGRGLGTATVGLGEVGDSHHQVEGSWGQP